MYTFASPSRHTCRRHVANMSRTMTCIRSHLSLATTVSGTCSRVRKKTKQKMWEVEERNCQQVRYIHTRGPPSTERRVRTLAKLTYQELTDWLTDWLDWPNWLDLTRIKHQIPSSILDSPPFSRSLPPTPYTDSSRRSQTFVSHDQSTMQRHTYATDNPLSPPWNTHDLYVAISYFLLLFCSVPRELCQKKALQILEFPIWKVSI